MSLTQFKCFSRLRHEGTKPARQRSPVSTIVFTRLGDKDRNVSTWFGERKKDIHSRLGPEVVPRRRHASERRSASTSRSAKTQVTEGKKQEISSEATLHASVSAKEKSKESGMQPTVQTANNLLEQKKPTSQKMSTTKQKKYIKDLVIHHIKQIEEESTEAFIEHFKVESMHVNGDSECMKIFGFMHGITNPDLIKSLNDNIPKFVDNMMSVTTASSKENWR
nr:reverse transcriptase domain-containing protein [Tanacetum cinerariifolium]